MKPLHIFRPLLLSAVLTAAALSGNAHAGDRSLISALRGAAAQSDRISWQSLNLTPAQKAKLAGIFWDAKAQQETAREESQALIAMAQTELAKDDADLDALASATQTLTDQRIANARGLRDQLIGFYNDDLDANQQATARAILLQRVERIGELKDALETLASLFITP